MSHNQAIMRKGACIVPHCLQVWTKAKQDLYVTASQLNKYQPLPWRSTTSPLNSSPPGQNGRLFADDIFRCIFLNEKSYILIKISLKFVTKGPIDNDPALVQVMAWRVFGNKPLSEPMLTRFNDAYMRHKGWVNEFSAGIHFIDITIIIEKRWKFIWILLLTKF